MTETRVVILNTSVYPYRDELIVELTGKDREGDVVVLSYQFDFLEPADAVTPKQPVTDFEERVNEALRKNGYHWE